MSLIPKWLRFGPFTCPHEDWVLMWEGTTVSPFEQIVREHKDAGWPLEIPAVNLPIEMFRKTHTIVLKCANPKCCATRTSVVHSPP
jgi:hypothetical protein